MEIKYSIYGLQRHLKSTDKKQIGEEKALAGEMLFSGESKNVEYEVTVPDKSDKHMKTVVAFANGSGGRNDKQGRKHPQWTLGSVDRGNS